MADSSSDHLQHALALLSQGDLAGAENQARPALQSPSTRDVAWAILGTIRLRQKKLDESSRYLQKAIQLNPNLIGARLTLSRVFIVQGKTGRAREILKQAMELDVNNPTPRINLAQLEQSLGNYRDSLRLIEPISPDLCRTPDGLLLLLSNYLALNQKDQARSLIANWMNLQQDVPPALSIELAKHLCEHGLKQEAIQVLERAKGTGPLSFEIAFALGGAYLGSGATQLASDYYERAANLHSNCVLCDRQIAKIAEREGRTEKALAWMIKAKVREPDNPEVLFEFGRICLMRNLYKDAIPALEKAVQLKPENDRYTFVLASAYGARLRCTEALALFLRLLKKHPEDPILNYAVGAVLYSEGTDLERAENYLRKSINLQSDQLGAYFYLAIVQFKKGDLDRSAQLFRDLLRRNQDHLPSLEQLGIILVRQKRNHEAQQVLETVLRLDPNSLTGHYQLGLLLGRLDKQEEAAKHLEIARRLEGQRRESVAGLQLYLLSPH